MLAYSQLLKGVLFLLDGQPHEVLESNFLRMQQRKPVMQAKVKNLITGKIVPRSFHQNESFEEADIEKRPMLFLYGHRGQYTFQIPADPKTRVVLSEAEMNETAPYLKPNLEVTFLVFNGTTIGIQLPIKADYTVKEAPPSKRGNTAQGGSKEVVLENGLRIQVPLFIQTGDVVRLNTQTGLYTERVEKA